VLRRTVDGVARLLNRPRSQTVYAKTGGVAATASVSGSGRVSFNPAATAEEKIDYLLRRDQELQDWQEAMMLDVRALPKRWGADIEAALNVIRSENERAVSALRDRHLNLRLIGVGFLVAGIVLATWGNLI